MWAKAMSEDSGTTDHQGLADRVRAGDRRALARAITLVESTRLEDEGPIEALFAALGPVPEVRRIGVSGSPGAGKSTFIEAFGLFLIARGRRPAVLAIDPSSPRSGGAILGDKTRMERLARAPAAFIRPTASAGMLGGVAGRTAEVIRLVEAAGFDMVIVETVGVGQSEIAVSDIVDMVLLLIAPGGGDELQGLKRGIVETADLIVVTKDDGDLAPAAGRLAADYAAALPLLRATGRWRPRVLRCAALADAGIAEIAAAMGDFFAVTAPERAARRRDQAKARLWSEVRAELVASLRADRRIADLARDLEEAVAADRLAPRAGARALIEAFLARTSKRP